MSERARTVEEYIDLVKQVIFELEDLQTKGEPRVHYNKMKKR